MTLLPLSEHYFDEGRMIKSCPTCGRELIEEAHSTLLAVKSDKDEGQFATNVPTTRVCANCSSVVFDKEKLEKAASMCLMKGKVVSYSVVGLIDLTAEATPSTNPTVMAPELPSPRVVGEKTGRNEPCPCGSGKKYKKCCLKK